MAKESGIAKSIGDQKEQDIQDADLLLVNSLSTGEKISKIDANYVEQRQEQSGSSREKEQISCDKCKFNLPAEKLCHIVEGSRQQRGRNIKIFFSERTRNATRRYSLALCPPVRVKS